MVTFLFSVDTITEAKQYAGRSQGLSQCLSQGGGFSSQVIWSGAPWCSTATARALGERRHPPRRTKWLPKFSL